MSRGNASVGSREKSSRGSDSPRRPTRSDLRNIIASAVGRLRNSPERTFQRLGTHFDLRVRRRDHVLREFASRAGVCVGEAQHV